MSERKDLERLAKKAIEEGGGELPGSVKRDLGILSGAESPLAPHEYQVMIEAWRNFEFQMTAEEFEEMSRALDSVAGKSGS